MSKDLLFLQSTDSIGERLRLLRTACQLSRREFSERSGIPEPSLRSWELDLSNISEKSLLKLIEAFAQEGLQVDLGWITTGGGALPAPSSATSSQAKSADMKAAEKVRECAGLDIALEVMDTSNAPALNPGDAVLGAKRDLQDILPSQEDLYILELEDGLKIIRRISRTYKNLTMDLSSINPSAPLEHQPYIPRAVIKTAYLVKAIVKG
ncbi:MAG: helix-turn-helix domain-containing protein [Alphaproteobacteria bacterium]